MPLVVEATFEDGVLKPCEPLPLKEHERVRITIHAETSPILQAYGITGWTGDAELLERLAEDPESDSQEP